MNRLAYVAVALAGLVYLNALDNPFVYDDHRLILENRSLLYPTDVGGLLLHEATRPIMNLSYAIDRTLWGPEPFGFHVTNVLLHTLIVFSVIILLFLTMWGRPPSVEGIAVYFLYCVLLAGIVVGFSLGASVLFLRYRDLNQVWEVVAQAGFFVAPIIYPLRILPEHLHFYLYVWPPTPIIEFSRDALIRGVVPSTKAHTLLVMVATLTMACGIWVFRRYEPRAAEYL